MSHRVLAKALFGGVRYVPAPARSFADVATMVAEGIEDQTRGEVSDMGWAIERANLMHAEFTCDGKRYRVEMREITGSENMAEPTPRVQTWLDCDHCGNVAIESADGVFTDGDGGACSSCGLPGYVSCCSETEPHWFMSEDPNTKCKRADCEECNAGQAQRQHPTL